MLVLLATTPVSSVDPGAVQAGGKGPRQYNGTIDAWKKIAANEGSKAFFKVSHPSMSAVFCVVCWGGHREKLRHVSASDQ